MSEGKLGVNNSIFKGVPNSPTSIADKVFNLSGISNTKNQIPELIHPCPSFQSSFSSCHFLSCDARLGPACLVYEQLDSPVEGLTVLSCHSLEQNKFNNKQI